MDDYLLHPWSKQSMFGSYIRHVFIVVGANIIISTMINLCLLLIADGI
jgi:hypothetical protein